MEDAARLRHVLWILEGNRTLVRHRTVPVLPLDDKNVSPSLRCVKPLCMVISRLSLDCFRVSPEPCPIQISPWIWPFSLPQRLGKFVTSRRLPTYGATFSPLGSLLTHLSTRDLRCGIPRACLGQRLEVYVCFLLSFFNVWILAQRNTLDMSRDPLTRILEFL